MQRLFFFFNSSVLWWERTGTTVVSLAPKSCLPLPPSGLMTNSKTLHVVLSLFLLFLSLLMKKNFLNLAATSTFPTSEMNEGGLYWKLSAVRGIVLEFRK